MRKKNIIRAVSISLLAAAAVCGFFFARAYQIAREEIAEYTAVQSEFTTIVTDPETVTAPVVSDGGEPGAVGEPFVTDRLPLTLVDFSALLLANPETIGWLVIPGTAISYPVVQAPDNAKYLNQSFQGRRSGAGALFADKDNGIEAPDTNTIIYGHNMGSGREDMFGTLLSYKDCAFYEAHRYIQFDTVYRPYGWWEVFAVIEHDMRAEDFDYLQLRFGDDAFTDWIDAARERSLHDSGVEIKPGDLVLTLSTCDRSKYGRHGRFLILAVNHAQNEWEAELKC